MVGSRVDAREVFQVHSRLASILGRISRGRARSSLLAVGFAVAMLSRINE